MIKKILSNTLYLAPLLVSHTTYSMITSIELLEKQTQNNTQHMVIINNGNHHPKKWPKRNKSQIYQMKSIIRQLERKQTPTQLYVEFREDNIKRFDMANKRCLSYLELNATGILWLNALKQLKDKNKKDQRHVIYHAFDSRDDLDFNTLRLFINPPISSKKSVEYSNNDTDDSKTISITDFIQKYKAKRDSLFLSFTTIYTLSEKHKKQEETNILNKFDNLFVLLRTCNEVLKKNTLSELVSELYKIYIVETPRTRLEKIASEQKLLFVKYNSEKCRPNRYTDKLINSGKDEENMKKILKKFDQEKLERIDINLREKLKLEDENKTIFEQLKESYYRVNYLIPEINFLRLFEKHQSKNDTLVFQCHEMYGKNFAKKLRDYYGFIDYPLTNKSRKTKEIFHPNTSYATEAVDTTRPLVSFEKEILDFLELHPTLMEKFEDCVLTRKNAKFGSIFLILFAAASGGYYWLNSDVPNED